jgi:two-component system sensor histidine kinase KdpD
MGYCQFDPMNAMPPIPGRSPTQTGSPDEKAWPQEGEQRISFDLARSGWREYALVVAVIAALTGVGLLLPKSYYVQIGLVYLLAINLLSLRVGRGPLLTAGVLSAFIWDYLFVYPYFNIAIAHLQDVMLLVTYFVVALVAGQLTAQIRAQAHLEHLRQVRATALFQFTRALAEAKTLAEAADTAVRQINDLLGVQTALAFVNEDGLTLAPWGQTSSPLNERERDIAFLAFRSRQPAGRFTHAHSDCAGYYTPMIRDDHAWGVLGVQARPGESLTVGQRDLLDAFAQQLALMVERTYLRAAGEREKLLAESEKLHRVLLESVSHELRTPLAVINATTEELADANIPACTEIVEEIRAAGQRLNRLVGNLLDQTRLESGALRPRVDWCDPQDLVNAAVEGTRDALADHPLEIFVPENMAFVRADFALTEQSLANLLLNAALHTPPGTPVSITAGIESSGKRAFFVVADRGPGFPATTRDELFHKFTRGATAPAGGLGLGLSIVQGFISTQGGEVTLGDNPGGGAKITLYLPHTAPDNPPPE